MEVTSVFTNSLRILFINDLDTKTRFRVEEIFADSQMFPDSSVLEYSDSLAFTLKGYSDS